ncbi:lytic transglycosylase domain-containing protein [Actinoplanes hulinensis]|uniref:aggregation-promoting factor C-terminal-like domain-containing protein n=1 Tax=Actinoplanes hulinensis TaxID=1144547 RepID=UPI0027E252AF|nr:lytic transglycosylase domain-containing protein [Actinoplanes hulinensis]
MTRPHIIRTVGARAAAAALLLAALAGGVHLAQRPDSGPNAAGAAETQRLLAERERQHAAARAVRDEAKRLAEQKASAVVKTAVADARALETARKKVEAEKAAAAKRAAEVGPVPYTGTIPAACRSLSGSREVGCALMIEAGFEFSEFSCLNKLWDHESGWNYRATNPSSGAYGIPQAYPGSKMSSIADDWKINPATQIKWGLGYVKGRYDSPCGAWNHFQDAGSY